MTTPVPVKPSTSATWAMPKSISFTVPSLQRMTLPGLTSRWTIPRSWAAASASHTGTSTAGGLVRLEPAAVAELVAQRASLDALHDDEDLGPAGEPDVVHGDDVRVVDHGGRAGLVAEPAAVLGVAAELGGQQLHRDGAPELAVDRAVDLGHPAAPDQALQLVAVAEHARRARVLPHVGAHIRRVRAASPPPSRASNR